MYPSRLLRRLVPVLALAALLLMLAALLLMLAACGNQSGDTSAAPSSDSSSGDSGLYHLRIAYSPSLCQAPLHIAVEKGFFEAEGIEPENIQIDAAHVQEAIGADQVDVGFGLIGKFLQPVENGAIDVVAMSDPIVSQFVQQYDLNVLVDTATSEEFSSEYCCASFVSNKLAEEHPDIAAAFTRAVLKASVYVNEHPEEAAKIQLDKKYVTGDLEFNTSLLKSYNYIPSVQGGYDAIKLSVEQLAQIGILKAGTDAQQFTDNVYAFYDDVPDSYTAADIADIA